MICGRSHTKLRWNFGSRMSPVRIRLARPSIRSTLGCGSLGTGAVGPDVVVAVMAEKAIELRRQESYGTLIVSAE
jgi:hypothetical protein